MRLARGEPRPTLWAAIPIDNTDDWEKESANMASIYQNSYLNIAASTAPDSNGGCLYTPKPATSFQFQTSRTYGRGQQQLNGPEAIPQTAFVRPSGSIRSLETSPLNTRAWVLQEVFLSRRTIHFTEDQIYWFCAERRASEDGTLQSINTYGNHHGLVLGPPQWDTLQKPHIDRAFTYTMWWWLVEDYSSRALTNSNDKMAALAGLTTYFQKKLGDDPLAGMWRAELLDSLCWSYDIHKARASTALPGAPSFSWVSADGSIKRNCCRLPAELPRQRMDRDLDILSANISWSGQPLTSQITGGKLVGRGLLVEINFALDEGQRCTNCSSDHSCRLLLLRGESRVGQFRFDRYCVALTGVVCCLAVTYKRVTLNFPPPQDSVYTWFHVLILESTGNKDEFRRVGVGKVWENSGVFENVEPRVVQIV